MALEKYGINTRWYKVGADVARVIIAKGEGMNSGEWIEIINPESYSNIEEILKDINEGFGKWKNNSNV